MMVRVASRIHTDLLPEYSNVMQTGVAIYQLKKSTISCAESPRSGLCLNGSPSTFSYFVNFNIHNLSRKLGIRLGCRQPTVCRVCAFIHQVLTSIQVQRPDQQD